MHHLEAAVAAPSHSVDVGCMQVNTKWHMERFHNLSDMLDLVQNADYAAGFLLDLHEAQWSWDDAVKHYHSSEPAKNVAYRARPPSWNASLPVTSQCSRLPRCLHRA